MSSRRSYYRIDRTFLRDESGTLSGASYLTSSKDTLIDQLPTAIHSGDFPDDNLELAWVQSVENTKNFLADLWTADLHIVEDNAAKVRVMKLIPDVTVRRGANQFEVRFVQGAGDLYTFDVHRTDANGALRAAYSSFAHLGGDTSLLESLPGTEPVEVLVDCTRLIERIPKLSGKALSEPLLFRPFHDQEEFRDFVREELPEELANVIPGGAEWKGEVPLHTWFPASDLLEACDDAGCGNYDFW